jgi:hypothetical protein
MAQLDGCRAFRPTLCPHCKREPNARWGMGKRWLAVWHDESGRERTRAFPTKDSATRYWQGIQTDRARGDYVDPKAGRELIDPLARKWLRLREVSGGSRQRYESCYRIHIEPVFGARQAGSVQPSEVAAWSQGLAKHRATRRLALMILFGDLRSGRGGRHAAGQPGTVGRRRPRRSGCEHQPRGMERGPHPLGRARMRRAGDSAARHRRPGPARVRGIQPGGRGLRLHRRHRADLPPAGQVRCRDRREAPEGRQGARRPAAAAVGISRHGSGTAASGSRRSRQPA